MESVQNVQDLKDQAQANIETVQAFINLLHNISENNEFNQTVSSNLKNLNVENLNVKDYQSLYFDYILIFIKRNIDYLYSQDFIDYIVDAFRQSDWGKVRSQHYPSLVMHETTFVELEKLLSKINKAIKQAAEESSSEDSDEIPDAF